MDSIVDAFGHWHNLSQHAFDAAGLEDPLGFGSALLKGDFVERANQVLSEFGAKAKEALHPLAGSDLFGTLAGVAGAAMAGKAAAAADAGPAGYALAVASIVASDWAKKAFKEVPADEEADMFQRGQWIAIDNGDKTVRKKVNRLSGWAEMEFLFEAPDQSDYELFREEDYSTGFIVQSYVEGAPGHVIAFNFATEKEEEHHFSKVRILPVDVRADLDENPALSLIREMRFRRDELDAKVTLGADVSINPGAEVVDSRDGYRKFVNASQGEQLVLEDVHGNVSYANISEVKPGRQTSSIAYNYQGKTADGRQETEFGFSDPTRKAVFTGRWVWAPPSDIAATYKAQAELSVVCVIEMGIVVAYSAWDGNRHEYPSGVVKCVSDETNELLGSVTAFTSFRQLAVEGKTSLCQDGAPGRHGQAALCLGMDQTVLGPDEGSFAEYYASMDLLRDESRPKRGTVGKVQGRTTEIDTDHFGKARPTPEALAEFDRRRPTTTHTLGPDEEADLVIQEDAGDPEQSSGAVAAIATGAAAFAMLAT